VPWQTAAGLVLLAGAALMVPWFSRQPFYCHHLCPHGAAQEIIGRLRPKRWTVTLPADVVRALGFLPGALLALTIIIALTAVPFDLAGIEPFDAYLFRTAGAATLVVAAIGLLASCFIPQAYCRFGCPTGALLNFVRARGPTDRFSPRDALAGALLAVAVALNVWYVPVMIWIKGVPS
jgi:NosR/NirI family nitrous oxide reductase transcriptional regulator